MEAERQKNLPLTIGEKPEMTNANKARRQQMKQKSPQKLVHSQSHQALFVVVHGVSPTKRDLATSQGDQPMVGNGDAVSVVAEITERVLRASKRRLRINHPIVAE